MINHKEMLFQFVFWEPPTNYKRVCSGRWESMMMVFSEMGRSGTRAMDGTRSSIELLTAYRQLCALLHSWNMEQTTEGSYHDEA